MLFIVWLIIVFFLSIRLFISKDILHMNGIQINATYDTILPTTTCERTIMAANMNLFDRRSIVHSPAKSSVM